jgi:hypothetical protein
MWDSQCPFYINGLSGGEKLLTGLSAARGRRKRYGAGALLRFPSLTSIYIIAHSFKKVKRTREKYSVILYYAITLSIPSNPLRIMRNHTRNVENGVIGVAHRDALTSFTFPIRYFEDEFFRWSGGRWSCWDKSCSEYCHENTSLRSR